MSRVVGQNLNFSSSDLKIYDLIEFFILYRLVTKKNSGADKKPGFRAVAGFIPCLRLNLPQNFTDYTVRRAESDGEKIFGRNRFLTGFEKCNNVISIKACSERSSPA